MRDILYWHIHYILHITYIWPSGPARHAKYMWNQASILEAARPSISISSSAQKKYFKSMAMMVDLERQGRMRSICCTSKFGIFQKALGRMWAPHPFLTDSYLDALGPGCTLDPSSSHSTTLPSTTPAAPRSRNPSPDASKVICSCLARIVLGAIGKSVLQGYQQVSDDTRDGARNTIYRIPEYVKYVKYGKYAYHTQNARYSPACHQGRHQIMSSQPCLTITMNDDARLSRACSECSGRRDRKRFRHWWCKLTFLAALHSYPWVGRSDFSS